ncbi:unnamed protein product [Arctogadus glacialis]
MLHTDTYSLSACLCAYIIKWRQGPNETTRRSLYTRRGRTNKALGSLTKRGSLEIQEYLGRGGNAAPLWSEPLHPSKGGEWRQQQMVEEVTPVEKPLAFFQDLPPEIMEVILGTCQTSTSPETGSALPYLNVAVSLRPVAVWCRLRRTLLLLQDESGAKELQRPPAGLPRRAATCFRSSRSRCPGLPALSAPLHPEQP